MKTRYQKVICILACVFLIASFFVVPVSAATTYDATFIVPNEGDSNFMRVGPGRDKNFEQTAALSWSQLNPPTSWVPIGPAVDPSGVSYNYDFYNYENSSIVSFWIGQSSYGLERYQKSDVVYIDPGYFTLQVPYGAYVSFYNYRFSLRIINSDHSIGEVIASTSINDLVLSGLSQNSSTVYYPKMPFTFSKSMTGMGLLLVLEVSGSGMNSTGQIIGIFSDDFSVHYSDGPDPNLPTYNPPDQGKLDELEGMEDELMSSADAGLSLLDDLFTNFTTRIEPFFAFFGRLSMMFDRLVGGIPLLETVVYLSLTFGCFSSMLGLAGAIISSADRKGKDARSSKDKQQSKQKQNSSTS